MEMTKLEVNHYDKTKARFLSLDEEGQATMLLEYYWDGLDDLVHDLLDEVHDFAVRTRINPYNRADCAYDEVIDKEMELTK